MSQYKTTIDINIAQKTSSHRLFIIPKYEFIIPKYEQISTHTKPQNKKKIRPVYYQEIKTGN